MILELLLLLFILFLVTTSYQKRNKLDELNEHAQKIIKKAGVMPIPDFSLYETHDYPRTLNRKEIYLVLKDPDGKYYDDETLTGVLCHELAHVLSGAGDEHGKEFEEWETNLLDTATDLGFYSANGIDGEYPCFHDAD